MGLTGLSIAVVLIGVAVYFAYQQLSVTSPPPKLDVNKYWGPSSRKSRIDSSEITPFNVQYSADVINDLRNRLAEPLDKLPEPLEGVGFRYGFHRNKLHELVTFWRDDYLPRWNERQQYLNGLPQFQTEVQGLKIHFIHTKDQAVKTKNSKAIPLLLLHGWPGSVREFYELIPKLTNAQKTDGVSFVIVAPSLPGYGWSDGASIAGLGPAEIGVVLRNLMFKLGYQRFLIQGGDWGSLIGSSIATLFPQNVIGYHSNMCGSGFSPLGSLKGFIASFAPSYFIPEKYADFVFPMGDKFSFIMEEMGYFHIQATKPDTIGTALSYNPIGLAAYILEKFSSWTNKKYRDLNDGGLDIDFTKDALFDNLMVYYLSNSITTSVRLYSEAFSKQQRDLKMEQVVTDVPTGCARFKNDLYHELDWQLASKYTNLVHSTYHLDGGHFIALQLPDLLYKDFIQYVKKLNVTA